MSPKWLRVEKGTAEKKLRLQDCYQPFLRQCDFHESRAKYRLFGGAAAFFIGKKLRAQ